MPAAGKKKKKKKGKKQDGFAYDAKKGLGDGSYLIEYLIEKRPYKDKNMGDIIQYKVKWVGYKVSESTWEPQWMIPDHWKEHFENGTRDVDPICDGAANFELEPGSLLFGCAWEGCANVEAGSCEFQRCSGCSGTYDEPALIEQAVDTTPFERRVCPRYCSVECQKKHWDGHKTDCPAWIDYDGPRKA